MLVLLPLLPLVLPSPLYDSSDTRHAALTSRGYTPSPPYRAYTPTPLPLQAFLGPPVCSATPPSSPPSPLLSRSTSRPPWLPQRPSPSWPSCPRTTYSSPSSPPTPRPRQPRSSQPWRRPPLTTPTPPPTPTTATWGARRGAGSLAGGGRGEEDCCNLLAGMARGGTWREQGNVGDMETL